MRAVRGSAEYLSMPKSEAPAEATVVDAAKQAQSILPDRALVSNQLERVLSSRFFSGSKRSMAMLRYVVESALEGRSAGLKERTLGIEVFHRAAEYDSNVDPIVRLTAGDIRKRLAQYYCEPQHEAELRIALPSGSYVPEFTVPERAEPVAVRAEEQPVGESVPEEATVEESRRPWIWGAVALGMIAIAGLLFAFRGQLWPSSLDRFWSGVVSSRTPVLVCVGQPDRFVAESEREKEQADTPLGMRLLYFDRVSMADVVAVSRVAGMLGKNSVPYAVQGVESTGFADLRRGPTVLVSGMDNQWTVRAVKDLRFSFANQPGLTRAWIADKNNPLSRTWLVDFGTPYTELSQDYGLLARFVDPTTGQPTVVIAGIGANGTLAASECAVSRSCTQMILQQDANHGSKNIEAVIGTQVVQGKSGQPTILAVHSW